MSKIIYRFEYTRESQVLPQLSDEDLREYKKSVKNVVEEALIERGFNPKDMTLELELGE